MNLLQCIFVLQHIYDGAGFQVVDQERWDRWNGEDEPNQVQYGL